MLIYTISITIKIIHLLASNQYSGAEAVVVDIIKSFSAKYPEKYEFYYCSPDGKIAQELKELDVHFLPLKRLNKVEINKYIEKIKPDIIHAHDFQASYYASKFANKQLNNTTNVKNSLWPQGKNLQVISHIHNLYSFMHPRTNPISIIYRKFARKFARIIVVSDAIYNVMKFDKSIIKKTIALNNYCDPEKIKKLAKQENEFEIAKFDIAFVGRLTPQKQPLEFLKLIQLLKVNNPVITAIMIGRGEMQKKVEQFISKNDLQKNVKLTGFVPNPYPIIKNSKILAITSKYEGYSLVASEGTILGKAVISTNFPGIADRIGADNCAATTAKLVTLANELLSNSVHYEKTVLNQTKLLNSLYTWNEGLDTVYDKCLQIGIR